MSSFFLIIAAFNFKGWISSLIYFDCKLLPIIGFIQINMNKDGWKPREASSCRYRSKTYVLLRWIKKKNYAAAAHIMLNNFQHITFLEHKRIGPWMIQINGAAFILLIFFTLNVSLYMFAFMSRCINCWHCLYYSK